MSAHTPGPWRVFPGHFPGIDANSDSVVLFGRHYEDCGIRGVNEEERLANANLIAAAPDMLAALRDALHTLEHSSGDEPGWAKGSIAVIRAAIAKAEGRP